MLTKNLRAVLLHELVLEDTIRQVYIILPATSQQITSLRNLCILPVSFILVVPILRSHRPGDIVIDAARMLSRVFVTVGCPSVRPSVCLSHRSTAATEAGGFVVQRPAGRK